MGEKAKNLQIPESFLEHLKDACATMAEFWKSTRRLSPGSIAHRGEPANPLNSRRHETMPPTLFKTGQQAEEAKAHQQAQAWLALNREKYAGQWIAVRGAELLATGTTAREVYAQVRGMRPSALILKIEHEDLPSAGW